jgi:uncharacterized protein
MSDQEHSSLKPVTESTRIDVMDILRGFALLGIVFMNIEWFNRSGTDIRTFDISLTGLDHAIGWLVRAFVEGKFYKLFALLFGMGFAVMLLRAKEAGRPFTAWFVRRMLVLFLIAMVHQIFIWDGDILHDYAFAGLVFLGWVLLFETRWLRRFNTPSAFLKIGIVMLLLPLAVMTYNGMKIGMQTDYDSMQEQWQQQLNDDTGAEWEQRSIARAEKEVAIMSGDSYKDVLNYRISGLPAEASKTVFFTMVLLIPIFLIGYWFVASGVLKNHREHRRLFNTMTTLGLSFGTMLSVSGLLLLQHPASDVAGMLGAMAFWTFNLGQLVLAAGYFGLIVVLMNRTGEHRVLKCFAPFGRMALTNYIMQSVILVVIFHGYALGYFGQVSRASQMLIVVAIVGVQMLFSAWWLKRFRFGPLEWLWRSGTYMSWQPLRI